VSGRVQLVQTHFSRGVHLWLTGSQGGLLDWKWVSLLVEPPVYVVRSSVSERKKTLLGVLCQDLCRILHKFNRAPIVRINRCGLHQCFACFHCVIARHFRFRWSVLVRKNFTLEAKIFFRNCSFQCCTLGCEFTMPCAEASMQKVVE